ncbi:MAG: cell envelope integrity protein TolA [Pseudomonadota bacterium]
MPSAADRIEFGPPRDAGSMRAFGFALLAHALLIAALTWGVNWKRTDQSVAFEAEIWSAVPQAAAPKLVEPPPPPPPEPAPKQPEVKAAPPTPNVDIALEQEKKRKLLQQQKEREELQAKKDREQKAKEDQARKLAAQQDAKKLEDQKLAKQREQDKQAQTTTAKQREEALKRMMGLAGASGASESTGTARQSSGPSQGYGARVRAAVKPNIVFADDVSGNPIAEVEVRTSSNGTIISQRLVKSSGNAAWDEAVIKAIIRTGTMPRDVDGRVPSAMVLSMRVKD